jgi:hypothetical protein
MTSPLGMDELFWGRDHEDVNNWAKRLTMAAEVRDLNGDKLFKIAKLNLRGRAKEWFKRLAAGTRRLGRIEDADSTEVWRC